MASKVKQNYQRKAADSKPRRPGHTRLSSKNQVTIPVDVVRKAGLKPGDTLDVSLDRDGRLLLERELSKDEKTKKYAGFLTGAFEPEFLKELREEWDE